MGIPHWGLQQKHHIPPAYTSVSGTFFLCQCAGLVASTSTAQAQHWRKTELQRFSPMLKKTPTTLLGAVPAISQLSTDPGLAGLETSRNIQWYQKVSFILNPAKTTVLEKLEAVINYQLCGLHKNTKSRMIFQWKECSFWKKSPHRKECCQIIQFSTGKISNSKTVLLKPEYYPLLNWPKAVFQISATTK